MSVLLGRGWRHLDHLKYSHLINIHHLTSDSKNGLNVVLSECLDQLANRWVVLDGERDITLSTASPTSRREDTWGVAAEFIVIKVMFCFPRQAVLPGIVFSAWGGGEVGAVGDAEQPPGTYKLIAPFVHVVLQVALAIVGGQDARELAIPGKVEAVVSRKHQQAGHIAPANQVLQVTQRVAPVPEQGWQDSGSGRGPSQSPVSAAAWGRGQEEGGLREIRVRGLWGKMLSCTLQSDLPCCQVRI